MFRSASQNDLDDPDYDNNSNRKSILSIFSFSTLILNRRHSSSSTSNQFRSFVPKTFLQNKNDPDSKILIQKFLQEEKRFIENLNQFQKTVKELDPTDQFQWNNLLRDLKVGLESFVKKNKNSKDYLTHLLDFFSDKNPLFTSVYKNVIAKCYHLKLFLETDLDNKYNSNDLTLPKRQIGKYVDLLRTLKESGSHENFVYDRISNSIKFLREIESVEKFLNNILSKSLRYHRIHIERCQAFVQEVIPQLHSKNEKVQMLKGKIEEILIEEKILYEENRCCLLGNNIGQMFQNYLKHAELFYLYHQNEKRNTTIQQNFCKKNHVKQNFFTIVPDHLFNLQHVFQTDEKKEEGAMEALRLLIIDCLKEVDHLSAISKIIGENIRIDDQGDVILRHKFLVRNDKNEFYESMVFLFPKSVVFTTEEKLSSNITTYMFQTSLPIELLGIELLDNEFNYLKIYTQVLSIKKNVHILEKLSDDPSDVILKWKHKIREILMKQVVKLKEEMEDV